MTLNYNGNAQGAFNDPDVSNFRYYWSTYDPLVVNTWDEQSQYCSCQCITESGLDAFDPTTFQATTTCPDEVKNFKFINLAFSSHNLIVKTSHQV